MSDLPVTTIELLQPEVIGQSVKFDWTVSPETEIYNETGFHLTFPDDVPIGNVPMRLWWTVFIMCIHSHWALLRPCVIYLPVRLGPGESKIWTRLILSYVDTLDAVNEKLDFPRDIRIIDQGECLERVTPLKNRELCATAFSGGKDSLAQAGLLMEMGFRPILVSTTSPMEGEHLHVSRFREKAMEQMRQRFGLEVLEVHSDLRGNWNNVVPRQWGFDISMNEISDTLLYTAALAVCGYVRGATGLYLASEAEVSQNHVEDGVYLQLKHFMYSALTQAGISSVLNPFGLRYGSITSALHSDQVQALVTQRYPHMSDLQCSCWQSDEFSKACSVCAECKRLAWVALATGGSPANLGVNVIKMIQAWVNFKVKQKKKKSTPYQPSLQVHESFKRQIAHAILSISPETVESYIRKNHPEALSDGSAEQTLQDFLTIQGELRDHFPETPPESGYRTGFLSLLDESIADRLLLIFDDQFRAEQPSLYAEQLENLTAAINWVAGPVR